MGDVRTAATDNVTLYDESGVAQGTPTNPLSVDGGLDLGTPVTLTKTTSGDSTLVTPSSGNRIRVRRVRAMYDPTATTPPVMTLKLGSVVIDYGFILSGRMYDLGAVDAPLIFSLDSAVRSTIIVWYEEITP